MARARLKNFYFTPRRLFTAPFERALGFFMPFFPINDKKNVVFPLGGRGKSCSRYKLNSRRF